AYNIQDGDGIPYLTNGLDWAEEMAKQQATFVGGTGYQYADTDFLAYSAKLYTQMAQQLLVGSGPVSVGSALVKAKQAYLAGLANVSGIDQKTLIESTVYGLPMVGVNMPTGRTRAPAVTTGGTLNPNPVSAGTPGGQLGLQTVPYDLSPVLDADNPAYPNTTGHAWTKSAGDPVTGTASSTILQWHTGRDGVQSGAGLPTLPKQIDDVTSTNGSVLRGVGFRSGSYTDSGHITPLTGAPTTEQDGIHTSFAAAAFFPQKLTSVNYFDALGNPVAGTTKLVTTPVQYRAEVGASTDTERVYQHLGLSLFYSSNIDKYGQNTPALAAPPSITGVSASSSADGGSVSVTAHITGDPSAGVQQVWVTYTGEAGPFQGTWASIDLAQDSTDSTLWFGRITLPAGQRASDVRLILQAVNGVGVVGLDNNFGDGYIPNVPVGSIVRTASLPAGLALDTPVPTGGQLGTTVSVGATLTGAPVGSPVVFSIASASATAFTADLGGHVTTTLRLLDHVGPYALTASYAGDNTHVPASASSPFSIDRLPTTLKLSVVAQSKTAQASAVLTGPAGELLAHQSVILSITGPGHPAATPLQFALTTDGQGYVSLPPTSLDDGSYTVTATFAGTPSTYLPSTDPSSGPGAAMAIDTTAPLVTVLSQLPAANGLGWNHGTVTVTWQCTDAGVGGQTCPSPTTVAVDGASQVINSPAVCDQLNNCSIGTTTVSLDTVGPTVVGKQSPAPNGAVWTNSAVTVSWSCTDATSGVLSCPPDQSVSTQGANQTATATGTDKADNSTLGSYGPINIDTIAPTLVGHPTTSANGAGWYNGNVTIQWSCTDAGSGPGVCPANSIIGGEGPGLNTGADLTDIAGNTTHALSDSVSIDQTAPVTTSDITDAWWSTDAIVHLTPAKDLSGVAQTWYQIDTGAWTVGTTFTVTGNGAHTVRFHSVDVAGNIEADQTATVRIDGSVPTITGAIDPLPNGAGWIKAASATVTFTCTAGVSLVQSCSTPVTLTSEGREQSVTGTVVSNAGKSYSTAVKVSIDRTPPVISGAATTLPNGIGWYNSPVTVHFTCTDQALLSGVAACSDDVTLSADGTALSVPGSSTDLAGNTASTSVTGIKIDRTAPTISVSATTNPNAGGWYNGAVTFHFTCFDALSTIATCPVDQTVSADGAGQFATGVAVDRAGNQTSVKSALVKIDSAAPKVTVTGVSTGLFYTTAPKPSCATVDQLSGLGTSAVVTVSGTGGSVTATCSGAVDAAGNAAPSVSVTYLVLGSVKVSANFTPGSSTSNLGDVLPGLNGKSTATITASASYASTGVLNSSVDFVYNITGGVHFTSTKTTSFTINGTDSVITGVGTIAGRTGSFPFQVLLHSGAAPGSGPSRVVVQIFAPTIVAPLAGASATPAVLYQASGNLASTEVHTGRDN
ncbi:MAG: hypothetical protein WCI22_06095, partial [Actinomycetota bacterium]